MLERLVVLRVRFKPVQSVRVGVRGTLREPTNLVKLWVSGRVMDNRRNLVATLLWSPST
jgi:hypothetical protein